MQNILKVIRKNPDLENLQQRNDIRDLVSDILYVYSHKFNWIASVGSRRSVQRARNPDATRTQCTRRLSPPST